MEINTGWKGASQSLAFGLLGMIAAFQIGRNFGETSGQVSSGAPAYAMITEIRNRLQKGDPALLKDIKVALIKMEPDNGNGENGEVMRQFVKPEKP